MYHRRCSLDSCESTVETLRTGLKLDSLGYYDGFVYYMIGTSIFKMDPSNPAAATHFGNAQDDGHVLFDEDGNVFT
jgi:hypothetical protein